MWFQKSHSYEYTVKFVVSFGTRAQREIFEQLLEIFTSVLKIKVECAHAENSIIVRQQKLTIK